MSRLQERGKLYIFLMMACVAGYIWLYTTMSNDLVFGSDDVTTCLIKHTTNIPCPSCGATRSVASFLNGHFIDGLYWNPLGLVILAIMLITPIWIFRDFMMKDDSLLRFYRRTESFLRRRSIAIPAIAMVIINWIWNISKGL